MRLPEVIRPLSRFTLVELMVVVAIITLLLSLLLPAMGKSKELARRIACFSNLKTLGYAMCLYADSNEGQVLPWRTGGVDSGKWYYNSTLPQVAQIKCRSLSFPYNWDRKSLCPNATAGINTDNSVFQHVRHVYGVPSSGAGDPTPGEEMQRRGYRLFMVKHPSQKVMWSETTNDGACNYTGVNPATWLLDGDATASTVIAYRHNGRKTSNMTLYDGHVENLSYVELQSNPNGIANGMKFRWFPYADTPGEAAGL